MSNGDFNFNPAARKGRRAAKISLSSLSKPRFIWTHTSRSGVFDAENLLSDVSIVSSNNSSLGLPLVSARTIEAMLKRHRKRVRLLSDAIVNPDVDCLAAGKVVIDGKKSADRLASMPRPAAAIDSNKG